MMPSQIADDRIPLNREDVDIGMRHRIPALSELFCQGKEKRVGSEIVEENFHFCFQRGLIGRHGLPEQIILSGMSSSTTEPAVITQSVPIVTPGATKL